jgi:hypothetical protein
MPQNPILILEKEGDTPIYMWSVDASEALRFGDYVPLPPDKEVSPEQRAAAMSRFKTGQALTHPELQTGEEKEKARREANEKAELMAGVPEGAQVVVMAPHPEEGRAASRARGGAASRPASSTPPASSSTAPSTPPASSSTVSSSAQTQTRRE